MAMWRCNVCGGEYADVGSDGLRYFHACPPLTAGEVQAAVTAGTITLRRGETVDQALASRAFPRIDARDENLDKAKVAAARQPDGTRTRGLAETALQKAPGRGATVVPDSRGNGR